MNTNINNTLTTRWMMKSMLNSDHFESPGSQLPGSNLSNKGFSGGKSPTFWLLTSDFTIK